MPELESLILIVNLHEKVSLCVILGAFVQKLIFQDGARSSFISQFSKKPWIFARDMEAKFFITGP